MFVFCDKAHFIQIQEKNLGCQTKRAEGFDKKMPEKKVTINIQTLVNASQYSSQNLNSWTA